VLTAEGGIGDPPQAKDLTAGPSESTIQREFFAVDERRKYARKRPSRAHEVKVIRLPLAVASCSPPISIPSCRRSHRCGRSGSRSRRLLLAWPDPREGLGGGGARSGNSFTHYHPTSLQPTPQRGESSRRTSLTAERRPLDGCRPCRALSTNNAENDRRQACRMLVFRCWSLGAKAGSPGVPPKWWGRVTLGFV